MVWVVKNNEEIIITDRLQDNDKQEQTVLGGPFNSYAEAYEYIKRQNSQEYEYSGLRPFERASDDGRCLYCEGWGCQMCNYTGGY